MKNGLAYSGNKEECGSLEQKVKHAIDNKILYIQLRAADFQTIAPNDINKAKDLIKKYQEIGGQISVHLPNPEWDYDNLKLEEKNSRVISAVKNIGILLGIKNYTIHPHFNRLKWEKLEPKQQLKVLKRMAKYFSKIAQLGVTLAIENIPVRFTDDFKGLAPTTEKEKAKFEKGMKNISYGMTIEEIDDILNLTRDDFCEATGNQEEAQKLIGITYDTGHSLAKIKGKEKSCAEIERWIGHFHEDIRIFHVSPSSDEKQNDYVFKSVIDCSWQYDVKDALTYVEAHENLQTMANYNKQFNQCLSDEKAKIKSGQLEKKQLENNLNTIHN